VGNWPPFREQKGARGKLKIMKKRTIERSMFYNASPAIFSKAEELRKNMTEAELILWNKLNKKQLGFRFKSQHPIEHFIADFYCHKAKLVVEIDGKIHEKQKEYDLGRESEIEKYGITIIRFTNDEIINNIDSVLEKIKMNL